LNNSAKSFSFHLRMYKNTQNLQIRRSKKNHLSNQWNDLYHYVVNMRWGQFLFFFAMVFILVNVFFGLLFRIQENSIGGIKDHDYLSYFFFSVQTIATIGYGSMYPQTLYGHILVTIEAMIGLLGVGMFTAIAFAKLSLPKSRIIFSKVAIIGKFEGQDVFMFRVANERNNRMIGAAVELNLFRQEVTQEGLNIRRIYDLELVRNHTPMLLLSWLVIHPINVNSPLHKLTQQDLEKTDFSILASITGLDETISQAIHSHQIYTYEDIHWNHRFVDLFGTNEGNGALSIDLTRINQTTKV